MKLTYIFFPLPNLNIQPLVNNALQGYNCSVFSYGQTGSGKTYTMFGIEDDNRHEGLIPRICRALLHEKQSYISNKYNDQPATIHNNKMLSHSNSQKSLECKEIDTFRVSYVEIYLERVRDLLSENEDDNRLRVREDPSFGTYVAGAVNVNISNYDELKKILSK